ncbi:chalcone isomerase-like protein 1 [Nymphaea colorata]|nr:chalcone isomerase-like protein 1 [Nymphaea colorata]
MATLVEVHKEEVEVKEKDLKKEEEVKEKDLNKLEEVKEKDMKKEEEVKEKDLNKLEEVKENDLKKEEEVKEKDLNKLEEVKEKDLTEEKVEEVEPKTGVAFPLTLENRKRLHATGLRKKKVMGISFKIYAFGLYADHVKMKEVIQSKFPKMPEKPEQDMYDLVINSDFEMTVKLVIVFRGLTMSLVRKQFDTGLGASIKKLSGEKHEELLSKVMERASDSIKLPVGSVIEITRFPGFVMQTKVKGEIVGGLESELLCRAYISMYLGDEPLDEDAKESFGASIISLCSNPVS